MYAIIETGGKQYKVCAGDVVEVEKLDLESGADVELKVLMVVDADGKVAFDGKVKAVALGNFKAKKVIVYRFKAKKNVRKKQGHRQQYTRLKISSIG